MLLWLQVINYLREKRKPVVIDADGLYITTKNLDLIKGYDLAILTPNKNEFLRLAKQMDIPLEGENAPKDPLMEITKRLEGPVVLRKGAEDAACNGTVTISNGEGGSKRRSGGQARLFPSIATMLVTSALLFLMMFAGNSIRSLKMFVRPYIAILLCGFGPTD